MSKIQSIYAREILASGGAPSLEVTVTLESEPRAKRQCLMEPRQEAKRPM